MDTDPKYRAIEGSLRTEASPSPLKKDQYQLFNDLLLLEKGQLEVREPVGGSLTKKPTDDSVPLARRISNHLFNGDKEKAQTLSNQAVTKDISMLMELNSEIDPFQKEQFVQLLRKLGEGNI